jgi:hypothetical protein
MFASLGLAPAAEHEAADRESEPERPERECAHGDRLAPQRQTPPAADGLLFLIREELATPLLSGRSTCPKSEIDVVEQLRRLFGHASSV